MFNRKQLIRSVTDFLLYGSLFLSLSAAAGADAQWMQKLGSETVTGKVNLVKV